MAAFDREAVIVAGGAGFIGYHLCKRLLAAGARVVCIDNLQTSLPTNIRDLLRMDRFHFVRCDITQALPKMLSAARLRYSRIYNLACAASPPQYQIDPEHTMLTNVVGTSHLLRLAERSGARFLLTSTSEVYGDPEQHPQREDYRGWVSCTGPRACYDEGKRAAEAMTFDYVRQARGEARVARIFNTYGPRMHPQDGRVVSNIINQALAGDEITIYGDGSQTRSFCYVEDMVDGLIGLMESEGPIEAINLGNPDERSINELLEVIVQMTETRARVVNKPLPVDDPRRRRPDIARATAVLGWTPKVDLWDGLAATCDWFGREFDARPRRHGSAANDGHLVRARALARAV